MPLLVSSNRLFMNRLPLQGSSTTREVNLQETSARAGKVSSSPLMSAIVPPRIENRNGAGFAAAGGGLGRMANNANTVLGGRADLNRLVSVAASAATTPALGVETTASSLAYVQSLLAPQVNPTHLQHELLALQQKAAARSLLGTALASSPGGILGLNRQPLERSADLTSLLGSLESLPAGRGGTVSLIDALRQRPHVVETGLSSIGSGGSGTYHQSVIAPALLRAETLSNRQQVDVALGLGQASIANEHLVQHLLAALSKANPAAGQLERLMRNPGNLPVAALQEGLALGRHHHTASTLGDRTLASYLANSNHVLVTSSDSSKSELENGGSQQLSAGSSFRKPNKRPCPNQSADGDTAHRQKKRKKRTKRPLPKQPLRPVELTHRPPIDLAIDTDDVILSPYQCFLRKQIELFETSPQQVGIKAQGRNTPIVAGQIGIQCKHCSKIPLFKRMSGSVFYSQTLGGLYQVAQNMCKTHFLTRCTNIPEPAKQKLSELQQNLNRGSGGKEYWQDAAKKLGIIEDDNILKFTKEAPSRSSSGEEESKEEEK